MRQMTRSSEASDRPLLEDEVDPDPIRQFVRWFAEARRSGGPLPHAMSLATATPDGRPSIRSVLLKGVDRRGFVFYTHYGSRKGRELEANPRAAAALHWVALEREVRLEGPVERTDPEESDAYFSTRPRDSQLAARASPQSEVISSRRELERRYEEERAAFEGREVARPEGWGGFRIRPEVVEFWQGRPGRLHDRLRYVLEGDGTWRIERLAP